MCTIYIYIFVNVSIGSPEFKECSSHIYIYIYTYTYTFALPNQDQEVADQILRAIRHSGTVLFYSKLHNKMVEAKTLSRAFKTGQTLRTDAEAIRALKRNSKQRPN